MSVMEGMHGTAKHVALGLVSHQLKGQCLTHVSGSSPVRKTCGACTVLGGRLAGTLQGACAGCNFYDSQAHTCCAMKLVEHASS